MNLYIIADSLEPVSTKLLGSSQQMGSQFEQRIIPTHTFKTAPPIDVLLVPGGQGTRAKEITSSIEYMKLIYPTLQYLITICTGSGLAARAGLLNGKQATTNKLSYKATIALGPDVNWVSHARWVVDENIWTSSGVSAGIDVTFAWMAEVYGSEVAEGIANRMEYTRVTESTSDEFAVLYDLI